MGRDSAANRPFLRSRAHPFHCPAAAAMDARTDGRRLRRRCSFAPKSNINSNSSSFSPSSSLALAMQSIVYLRRTDGREPTASPKTTMMMKGPFYRVTAPLLPSLCGPSVGRQSANCRRIKNARKRQARPPQWRAEHGSRGSAIAVVHDSGLFGGALNYTSTFSVCPLVRPP